MDKPVEQMITEFWDEIKLQNIARSVCINVIYLGTVPFEGKDHDIFYCEKHLGKRKHHGKRIHIPIPYTNEELHAAIRERMCPLYKCKRVKPSLYIKV